jgi:hypothetical protein
MDNANDMLDGPAFRSLPADAAKLAKQLSPPKRRELERLLEQDPDFANDQAALLEWLNVALETDAAVRRRNLDAVPSYAKPGRPDADLALSMSARIAGAAPDDSERAGQAAEQWRDEQLRARGLEPNRAA